MGPSQREPYAEAKAFVENNPSCLKPIEKPQKKKNGLGGFNNYRKEENNPLFSNTLTLKTF